MSEFRDYIAHGWALCAIDVGRKSPTYSDWQLKPIPIDAADGLDGAGILHVQSGTCAIDIDKAQLAAPWLDARGVDLQSLLDAPEAVRIHSGRPGRAKLLYRLAKPLRTMKPTGSGLEFRCATASGTSTQDVLPPTVHPDTHKPYEWLYGEPLLGHWSDLPRIPAALYGVWRGLITQATPELPSAPSVALETLRKLIAGRDPNCGYEPWLKVGMALHHESGGAAEGFEIWDEWSKRGAAKYKGAGDLRAHWDSFQSAPGKAVITGASIVAETPASKDEFEDVAPEADGEDTTEKALREEMRKREAKAVKTLEDRLIYVIDSERYFDCERHRLITSDHAIEHMFTWMMPRKKGKLVSPIKMLKESSTKRYVDSIGFHPGESVIFTHDGKRYANAYQNELPEPLEPTKEELERITWLFDRIDDPSYRKWLLQFYGHAVQHPGVKMKSAPLIWSEEQGNGKTTLVRMIPALLVGSRYSKEVNSGLLNSDFTDYLQQSWHINLTEFRAGSRGEREAISKKVESWIADDVVSVNRKGMAGITIPNHFFVTGSSNAEDAASITNQDRKWAIHELHARQFTVREQEWIYTEFLLQPRAAGVLRHYFLHIDLAGFVASARAPDTAARAKMVEASMGSELEVIQTAFEEQADIFSKEVVLTAEVVRYVHRNCPARPTMHRIAGILTKAPYNGEAKQFRIGGDKRFRAMIVRNHDKWRHATGREVMAHIEGEDVDLMA